MSKVFPSHSVVGRKRILSCTVGELIGIGVAAAFAGVLISTIGEPVTSGQRWPTLMAMVAGAVFGITQWVVLRQHASRSSLWIVGNVLGWALALMWIYGAAVLPAENSNTLTIAVLGGAAGIFAGMSVGVMTGRSPLRIAAVSAE